MSCEGLNTTEIGVKVSKDSYFIDEIFDEENVNRKKVSTEQWNKERSEALSLNIMMLRILLHLKQ